MNIFKHVTLGLTSDKVFSLSQVQLKSWRQDPDKLPSRRNMADVAIEPLGL